ncbi:MAG: hypothetical protein U0T84_11550 [Chitinophagales bacterium]
MRPIIVSLTLLLCQQIAFAQHIKVYGHAAVGKEPVTSVLICLFENGKLSKQTHSFEDGSFFIRMDEKKDYILLFYKKGFRVAGQKIVNRMTEEGMNLPVYLALEPSTLPPDSELLSSSLLKQLKPEITASFLEAILTNEHKSDSSTVSELIKAAIDEDERFKNYKSEQTKAQRNGEEVTITQVEIGPDRYEKLENSRHAIQYFKNDKPITSTTYNFETTRRLEGVLKKFRKTKAFKKYKPMEHVKHS